MRSPLKTLMRNRSPVPLSGRPTMLPFMGSGGNDIESYLGAMGSVGTLFAIITVLANTTSRVEWKLYRKSESGNKDDREQVTQHAALDLWNKPNRFMPRQEFVETFQQHMDLTGEGWWLVARAAGSRLPLELWPMRPDRMAPVPHPQDFISGYTYTSPEGQTIPLDVQDVIQLRMPNPLDPYRGMGPVQSILIDIDASRYTSEWNRNFFLNSSSPGGIIEVDKRLSEQEFEELRMRWAEQHKGVAAAHRVALIEAGMKWVDRSFNQQEMQFVELRQVSRDVMREAFGMPKFAVGDVDDVNRASAEASAFWFAANMSVPRLERIKGALNEELLPLYGDMSGLEFDYENPIPGDEQVEATVLAARANAAATLITAGFDPEAVLEACSLPEIEFTGPPSAPEPLTLPPAPQEEEGEQPALPPGAPPAPPTRRGPPGGPSQQRQPAPKQLAPATYDKAEQDEREDWEERVEQLLEDWVTTVQVEQYDALIDQIERVVEQGSPEGLASLVISADSATALLLDAMNAQATAAAGRIAALAAEQGVAIPPVVPLLPPYDFRPQRLLVNVRPLPFKVLPGLATDLAAAARITTTNLASALTASASREALRVWNPAASAKDVAGRVRDHLENLTTATLGSELSAAIWGSENEGRAATLQQAEDDGLGASYYRADEVRDINTCKPCREVHDTKFNTLGAAREAYPFGGFTACEGRSRCRGTYTPVWE